MALYSVCVCRGYGGKVNTKMVGNGFLLTLLSWASNDLAVTHTKVCDKVRWAVLIRLIQPFIFAARLFVEKLQTKNVYLVFY